jgi:hypothetical protein
MDMRSPKLSTARQRQQRSFPMKKIGKANLTWGRNGFDGVVET